MTICLPVLAASYYRHWPRNYFVTTADRACIPLNTCYVTAAGSAQEAEGLAAWLNSTWIRAAACAGAVPAAGGFSRFNAAVVGAVPLPSAAVRDPQLAALSRAARTGTDVQEELDAIAARHLALSAREQGALRSLLHARSPDRRRVAGCRR